MVSTFPGVHKSSRQARHEDVEATRWLLSHGANANARIEDARIPLHVAADRNSRTKVVESLLEFGADNQCQG